MRSPTVPLSGYRASTAGKTRLIVAVGDVLTVELPRLVSELSYGSLALHLTRPSHGWDREASVLPALSPVSDLHSGASAGSITKSVTR